MCRLTDYSFTQFSQKYRFLFCWRMLILRETFFLSFFIYHEFIFILRIFKSVSITILYFNCWLNFLNFNYWFDDRSFFSLFYLNCLLSSFFFKITYIHKIFRMTCSGLSSRSTFLLLTFSHPRRSSQWKNDVLQNTPLYLKKEWPPNIK